MKTSTKVAIIIGLFFGILFGVIIWWIARKQDQNEEAIKNLEVKYKSEHPQIEVTEANQEEEYLKYVKKYGTQ